MEQDSVKLVTNYVGVWGWHLSAIMFLLASLILVSIPKTHFSLVLFFACFIIFVILEIIAYRRKNAIHE